jgi:hypothetical protein
MFKEVTLSRNIIISLHEVNINPDMLDEKELDE